MNDEEVPEMTSAAFSRSRRIVCGGSRHAAAKNRRHRAARRNVKANLAAGGDGYDDNYRRTGEREVS